MPFFSRGCQNYPQLRLIRFTKSIVPFRSKNVLIISSNQQWVHMSEGTMDMIELDELLYRSIHSPTRREETEVDRCCTCIIYGKPLDAIMPLTIASLSPCGKVSLVPR